MPVAPPQGYTLDQAQGPPPLPPGYSLDQPSAPGKPADTGSAFGAAWHGLLQGLKSTGQGVEELANRSLPSIGARARAGQQRAEAGIEQGAQKGETAYQSAPDILAHPWAALLGRVGGEALATAPLAVAGGALAPTGMAGRLALSAGLGAAGTATQPVANSKEDFWTQKERQLAEGAAAGGVTGAAGHIIGSAIAPRLTGDAATLAARGTKLSPGQMVSGPLGPAVRSAEAKLQSFPILGDFITHARGQSLKSYNIATINQALEPIGAALPKNVQAGNEAVKVAGNAVSRAYNDVLARIPTVVKDPELTNAFKAIELDARQRPAVWRNLRGEIARITDKLKSGAMTGREAQLASSELERVARGLQGSDDFFQREVARHLREARSALSDAIERQHPNVAPDLRSANAAWAMLTRVETAAGRRAGSEGIFTPMDLLSAVRSGAGGVRRREFARGDALMQDWAQAGQRLLPTMIPDSGTAGRLLLLEKMALAVPGLPLGLAYHALAGAGRSTPSALRRGIGIAGRRLGPIAAPLAGAQVGDTGPQGGTITNVQPVP